MEASAVVLMVVIPSTLWYLQCCLVDLGGMVNKKKVAYIAGCCCLFLR